MFAPVVGAGTEPEMVGNGRKVGARAAGEVSWLCLTSYSAAIRADDAVNTASSRWIKPVGKFRPPS